MHHLPIPAMISVTALPQYLTEHSSPTSHFFTCCNAFSFTTVTQSSRGQYMDEV